MDVMGGTRFFAQSHVVEFRTPERCRKWLCLKIIGRKTTKSWWFIIIFTIEFSDFKGIPDFRHAQMVFFPQHHWLVVLTQAFPGEQTRWSQSTKHVWIQEIGIDMDLGKWKNISLTWIVRPLGMIPLTNYDYSEVATWGRYNLPRWIDILCILALAMFVCK